MNKPGAAQKAIMDALNKGSTKATKRASMLGGGSRSDVTEFIPTGVGALDHYAIGRGGLPVGRMTELYSAEGAGKTSLVLSALAQCQKMGGVAILVETEVALEVERARTFGVDVDQLVYIEPPHIEAALGAMEETIKAIPAGAGPVLLAWDSLAATKTQDEFEKGIEDSRSFDGRAKLLSKAMRCLCPLAAEHRVALLFVNQVRDAIGVMFGDKTTTPGGRAVKFHASLRLQMYPGKQVKEGDVSVGKDVTIKVDKNKMAPPQRKIVARLSYSGKWDDDWTTLNHAKEVGAVQPRSRSVAEARAALDASGWSGVGKSVATAVQEEGSEE